MVKACLFAVLLFCADLAAVAVEDYAWVFEEVARFDPGVAIEGRCLVGTRLFGLVDDADDDTFQEIAAWAIDEDLRLERIGTWTVPHLQAQKVVSGDVDGDGHVDIVVVGSPCAVLWGRGTGVFEEPIVLDGTSYSSRPSAAVNGAAVGDFDADGRVETYLSCGREDLVFEYDGEGLVRDEAFARAALIDVGDATPSPEARADEYADEYTDGATAHDVDGDGRPELLLERFIDVRLVSADDDGTVHVHVLDDSRILGRSAVFAGGGDVPLQVVSIALLDYGGPDCAIDIATGDVTELGSNLVWSASSGDIDGDGSLDVIAWGYSSYRRPWPRADHVRYVFTRGRQVRLDVPMEEEHPLEPAVIFDAHDVLVLGGRRLVLGDDDGQVVFLRLVTEG